MSRTIICINATYQGVLSTLLPPHRRFAETCVTSKSVLLEKSLSPFNYLNWFSEAHSSILSIVDYVRVESTFNSPLDAYKGAQSLDNAVIVSDFSFVPSEFALQNSLSIINLMKNSQIPSIVILNSSDMETLKEQSETLNNESNTILIDVVNKRFVTLITNYDISATKFFSVGSTASQRQNNDRKAKRWKDKVSDLPGEVQRLLLSSIMSDRNEVS